MDSKKVLQELQLGEITLKDAKKQLKKIMKPTPKLSGEISSATSAKGFVYSKNKIEESRSELLKRKDSIAIVGMSGRYPDASELIQFWDNLEQAKNAVHEIPKSRWDMTPYYDSHSHPSRKVDCKWMGLLDDIECFDPLFFNISPSESEVMDPQQRIFLQEAYKAFEDAGYHRHLLSNTKCGVYLGIAGNEYGGMIDENNDKYSEFSATANNAAIAAARIAYYLNLTGPAISVDTACSSSLVAAHLACQALNNKEIDMALVGGVSLYLTPERFMSMYHTGMLSSNGQCKAFDNSADGYVPGEGAGAFVLKRLEDAEYDKDPIYGVIIGSGINQNGSTNGITAPSKKSQILLEREIYDKYKIHPETISYAEMHGTGTKLGDFIELEALSTVFKEKTNKKNYCAIGSVKSNIGHTTAAAGVASVQKVLLCMKNQKLVPTLHFEHPNEYFNFKDSPFYVNKELESWESPSDTPRRACVSSFGFSGNNAHIVIEEYIPKVDTIETSVPVNLTTPILFVLSAKNEEQLRLYAESMKNYIKTSEVLNLINLAYTLQVGREAMDYRLAFLAYSKEELLNKLEGFIENSSTKDVLTSQMIKNQKGITKFDIDEHEKAMWIKEKNFRKIGELWVQGWNPDWGQLYDDYQPNRINLPTYPFAKERYWINEDHIINNEATNQGTILSSKVESEEVLVPEVYESDELYLRDHKVNGEPVLIGMTHASLAINAFYKNFPLEENVHLHRLTFMKPIVVNEGQKVEVLTQATKKDTRTDFQVVYRYEPTSPWTVTAKGTLQKSSLERKTINVNMLKSPMKELEDFDHIYTFNPAIELGDSFKIISGLYTGENQVLARVDLRNVLQQENHEYAIHPLMIYLAFQALFPLLDQVDVKEGFLPFGIQDIHFQRVKDLEQFWVLVKIVKNSGEMVIFDAELINDQSQIFARLLGCSTKRIRFGDKVDMNENPEKIQSYASGETVNTESVNEEIRKYLTGKLMEIIDVGAKLNHIEANLMDLGLESAQFIKLADEIEKEIKINLNPTLFFEYPNIKELTSFFFEEHYDAFIQMLGNKFNNPEVPGSISQKGNSIPSNSIQPVIQHTPSFEESSRDDIAIIGMDGTFPGASNLDEFWSNLRDKTNVIKEIPLDHWDVLPWYDENPEAEDKTYCKWGGFVEDVDKFDAEFFNISPREAEWMDPQLRLLLQSIYATGEDAGYINKLRGTNTGVFVGVCCHDYLDLINEMDIPVEPYIGMGNYHSVIANRVSFLFDLKGPSISVDTACSSSLFAIHNACQALRNKECDMAFVGGVNLLLSSYHYRYFSSMGALSPSGRCHTFDEAADGYIPGECIATLLLKPLQQAKRDGDHIYGVIKGSAALHGGNTPSFTAPSVSGEENVIVKAWEDAGIHPETLSYIEAHGTGTKLGDPIEINSLKKAFKRFTEKEDFCAIGSAKANIGHAEGAAGIASLIKVILQMKNQQIPALPMFKKLNPYIKLSGSPLYINKDTEEWKTSGIPRRAGVSSFGISGAYAHVVIEEYKPEEHKKSPIKIIPNSSVPIVLSAKNEERLQEQVKQLLEAIQKRTFSDNDLVHIAYTLQVGREAMEERLGMLASSIKELEKKLKDYVYERNRTEGIYRGQAKSHKESFDKITRSAESGLKLGENDELLRNWVNGITIDWDKLYGDFKPSLIRLPSYPFAKERYWLPKTESKSNNLTTFIHPLLQQNTSNLSKQQFSTTFTGQEFFLKDHIVKGELVLPGVAHLEMALQAMYQSVSSLEEEQRTVQLKNVFWVRPIVVRDEPVQVHIGVYPEENGDIAFDIYSISKEGNADFKNIHSYGVAVLRANKKIPPLDLLDLQENCNYSMISSAQCYEAFEARGIHYGPGYVGIQNILKGPSQLLARIELPVSISDNKDPFILHPSLMDSALQASIAFMIDSSDRLHPYKPILPFAIEELQILDKCEPNMWALLRYSEGASSDSKVNKLDIDLCNDEGIICVRMRGVSSRVLEGDIQTANVSQEFVLENSIEPLMGISMLAPVWDAITIDKSQSWPATIEEQLVIVGGSKENTRIIQEFYPHADIVEIKPKDTIEEISEKLKAYDLINHVLWVAPNHSVESIVEWTSNKEQESGVLQVFRMIKALIQLDYGYKDLNLSIITIQAQPVRKNEAVNPIHASIHGLIGSLAKEYPNWKVRSFDFEANCDWPVDEILQLPPDPNGELIAYRDNEWYKQTLIPVRNTTFNQTLYRQGGVYVVIGGAGGIGEAWSEYMISQYKAQIIWIGRREKDSSIQAKLDKLGKLGPAPYYIKADASDIEELQKAYQRIKARYPEIHGIIHAAIVLLDQSLANMKEERFIAGLTAKVDVSMNMAQVFRKESLDFVLFFSSMISFIKAPGQSNYASGCTFKDAFAHQLSLEWSCPVKVMNWGYWGSVGIVASKPYQERMTEEGIGSIEPPEAMEALEVLLAGPMKQLALMKTTKPLILEGVNTEEWITIYPDQMSMR
ncbi:hypothetical protein CON45_21555 [Priestia megaterium]|nr:SDR family NAD(P)-dependent oxidoreductase [Priestia megaterium]PEA37028.1 hypothetical protein CON45_21555 [Priestia megaterium]PEE48969.1 hypothetical protein COM71_02760 [Priestia megaterium]